MTRRQTVPTLRGDLSFNEIDLLFNLELEEDQLRDAAPRVAANRKLEDVDYWRKQSGWYDDDESMREYNDGVHTSTYATNDDSVVATKSSNSSAGGGLGIDSEMLKTAGQICGALVGIVVLVMLVRAITRGSTRRKKADSSGSTARSGKKSGSRRRSSSRSRSKSRTRSRSKRAKESGGDGATGENYELMEDNKSANSRPRSRPRSRSKARSRSKSRSRPSSRREEMLV